MRRYFGILCVALLLAASTNAEAVQYTIQDLGLGQAMGVNDSGQVIGYASWLWENGVTQRLYDSPGGQPLLAMAINNSAQVAGWCPTATGSHASLWDNGTMQDLGILPNGDSFALGINNNGQIVGHCLDPSGSYAFLWQHGVVQDLGVIPGGYGATAIGINDSAQVVGGCSDSSGNEHALLWDNGAIRDLGALPGDTDSYAIGINNSGMVVGQSFSGYGESAAIGMQAFLWQNGVMQNLGPGCACGINDGGQVVGWSGSDAFVWQNGVMQNLGTLTGGSMSRAWDINTSGQVAGWCNDSSGDVHAVLWTPVVPEPSSVLALLCGIGGMGGLMLRRRK